MKTLGSYEKQTGITKNPHAPLKQLQEHRNLRKIQDPRRVDKDRDPFVTFEKPVPSAEEDMSRDKTFCKFKVMNDRVMVTNRGKTEKRMEKEIAMMEGRDACEFSPKKAEMIS